MTFPEIYGLMIEKHSLMPLALSTRGYNLRQRACSQKPLMSLGDWLFFGEPAKVVLSSYLPFLKKPFSIGVTKSLTPVLAMFDRCSDLETLRMSVSNLQAMLHLVQSQVDQLREAIDFRLEPLSHEVQEFRQRYEMDEN
jgi:hypothetical protein